MKEKKHYIISLNSYNPMKYMLFSSCSNCANESTKNLLAQVHRGSQDDIETIIGAEDKQAPGPLTHYSSKARSVFFSEAVRT